MSKANEALADLVRIKFDLIIPGLGCMTEILDEIAKGHPVARCDHAELCELAAIIEQASIKFGVIASRVSGVRLGDAIKRMEPND